MTDAVNDEVNVEEAANTEQVVEVERYFLYACEVCNWSFSTTSFDLPGNCPHCYNKELAQVEKTQIAGELRPPELTLKARLQPEALRERLAQFASGFWFRPVDLTARSLLSRLHLMYFPMWLVDADVHATWQAEAGYDYAVVSHEDHYNDNQSDWSSQEVTEERTRWEARAGKLKRTYRNTPAPAMEEHASFIKLLGSYDLEQTEAYQWQELKGGLICIPTRAWQDAWPEAAAALKAAAAAECAQAARAAHIRNYEWEPEYHNRNWTMLLLPFYSTYYLDDDNKPQVLFLNGISGAMQGERKASMKRAQNTSWWILGTAGTLFTLSILFIMAAAIFPALLAVGGMGVFLALVTGATALIPPAMAWAANRTLKNSPPL